MPETRGTDAIADSDEGTIDVLLVDDHPLWRDTLMKVLQREEDLHVVGAAGSGEEALLALGRGVPDVVVMDVDLPGMDGIEATSAVRDLHPGIAIVMLSASDDRDQVVDALRAGANGYLVKTAGAREIALAIKRVHAGELALPPDLAQYVFQQLHGRGDPTVTGLLALTDAEREVLELMATGRTNRAIADQLHLSTKTIEARVTAIYTKLGLEQDAADHRRVLAVVQYLDGAQR